MFINSSSKNKAKISQLPLKGKKIYKRIVNAISKTFILAFCVKKMLKKCFLKLLKKCFLKLFICTNKQIKLISYGIITINHESRKNTFGGQKTKKMKNEKNQTQRVWAYNYIDNYISDFYI